MLWRSCKFFFLLIIAISPLPSWGIGADEPPTILLDVISTDHISRDKAHLTYDTLGGFVLGQLEPGNEANLIIFKENPADNHEVLLDTKSYASFAIFDGKILKNPYDNVMLDTPE